jgi:beta-lactamase class A
MGLMRLTLPILASLIATLVFGFALASAQESLSTETHETSARPDIEKLIKDSGADVSIAFRSLDGGQELLIHADRPFRDSLAMKLPVMIELFAQAQARQLRLTDTIRVRNLFRSVVDGSAYAVDPASGDTLMHGAGQWMTLRDLCEAMITRDSDIAANLLIEKLGLQSIQGRIHSLGADGMVLASYFGDTKATEKGIRNATTPRALMTILLALAHNQVVDEDASREMIGILSRSRLPGSIAYTPTSAAARLQTPTGDVHAADIVFGARSFVLVVDVRGLTDPQATAALVGQIAHLLAAAI